MRHWIPPLVTEKMALSTARIHRVRGRPPLLAAGITSLIHSHSSSVRSLGYIFSFIYPFYTTHEDFSDRLLEMAEELIASDNVSEDVRSLLTAEKQLLSRISHEAHNLSLSTYAFLAE